MKRTIIFSILLLTVVATSRAQQVKILPIDLFSDANIINPVVIDSVLYFSSNKKNSIAVNYFNICSAIERVGVPRYTRVPLREYITVLLGVSRQTVYVYKLLTGALDSKRIFHKGFYIAQRTDIRRRELKNVARRISFVFVLIFPDYFIENVSRSDIECDIVAVHQPQYRLFRKISLPIVLYFVDMSERFFVCIKLTPALGLDETGKLPVVQRAAFIFGRSSLRVGIFNKFKYALFNTVLVKCFFYCIKSISRRRCFQPIWTHSYISVCLFFFKSTKVKLHY